MNTRKACRAAQWVASEAIAWVCLGVWIIAHQNLPKRSVEGLEAGRIMRPHTSHPLLYS